MEETKKPKIGFTTGDINGIGPELIVQVLSDGRLTKQFTPVVFGSGKLFSSLRKQLNNNYFNFSQADDLKEINNSKINIVNCWSEDVETTPGQPNETGGKYAFESLKAATKALTSAEIDALVTAPISKESIQKAGFQFAGHTEYLGNESGSANNHHLMFMVSDELKIGVVTGHMPVSEVSKAISKELIIQKVNILYKSLKKDFRIAKPKIAVLGLNPHAGEGGALGKEEKEIIIPAIEEIKSKNVMVFGPYPADGFFGTYQFKKFDAVLAMYHDQGLIPFKTIAFNTGVNYTAGLNVIRTSPDHGTAYDLVGKGSADPTSFREAVYLARDIIARKKSDE